MRPLFFTIIILFAFTNTALAQLSVPGTPLSDSHTVTNYADTVRAVLPPPEFEARAAIAADEAEELLSADIPIVAQSVTINLSTAECGNWIKLSDGNLVWQATFTSPGAAAVAVVFSKFRLPENAELFVYNADKTQVLGAFTYLSNNKYDIFNTAFVDGETLTIELNLYNPKSFDVELEVGEIVHFYSNNEASARSTITARSREDECFVSVNCSPEGNDWQNEKRGVAQMYFRVMGNQWGYCSGSMINNTRRDRTPYFLTAFHCGGPTTDLDKAMSIFYFEYEKMGCDTGDTIKDTSKTLRGAEMIASSSFDGGLDMLLLKINQDPPQAWDVYWNGWDFTKNQSPSGAGIHHPAPEGDVKKSFKRISIYTKKIAPYYRKYQNEGKLCTNFRPYNDLACGLLYGYWEVAWSQTMNGFSVTAPGSSGSPLFNNKKQIIGTLTSGESYCYNTSGADFYGRFDMQWDYYSNVENQLKHWLDPLGISFGALDGSGFISVETTSVDNATSLLSWQKSGNELVLHWWGNDGAQAEVYSVSGRLVDAKTLHYGKNSWLLPLGAVYLVRVEGETIKVQL